MSPFRVSVFALSLSLACALAAPFAVARVWDFTPLKPVVDEPGHKEWTWNGEHSLSLGVPAVVRYQRGGTPRIVITGPKEALDRVVVGEGRIARDNDGWHWGFEGDETLQVVITGVALDRVSIGGSGKIYLGRLDQERMGATIGGSGTITAEGKVEHVELKIGGSGRIDFGQVASRDAEIKIGGSGNIAVAPREQANVTIGGSGTVRMGVKPNHMRARVAGSGHVLVPGRNGGEDDILKRTHGVAQVEY
jgi:hypothetical protein